MPLSNCKKYIVTVACPNLDCKNQHKIQKDGFYLRREDSKKIQRYRCLVCAKKFSAATFQATYRQKKRRVNPVLFKLLASGVSMRRSAIILNINRKTVERKFIFLSEVCKLRHQKLLAKMVNNRVEYLQFDDLITSEHSKLKPLSVSVAVDARRRTILDCQVSQIPAFGHLAALSRKKYGKRKSYHKEGLKNVFENIKNCVAPDANIRSDEHKLYPEFVTKYFPDSNYQRFKGFRGCIAGQGELKKVHRDPLFTLNHTSAMLRANINRLIRRTWCTTKLASHLQRHLYIYICFHNEQLI